MPHLSVNETICLFTWSNEIGINMTSVKSVEEVHRLCDMAMGPSRYYPDDDWCGSR